MGYDRICISSGHGLYVRGAAGIIDEVDEARRWSIGSPMCSMITALR